ncbi:MAG: 50S ribosomal protein L6 [Patescibacteria group bacterium]
MSRIGKKTIVIPSSVEVTIKEGEIAVKGPKGNLVQKLHPLVLIEKIDNQLIVKVKDEEEKGAKALWGLFRKLVANMVEGVTQGFEKKLELVGVGYKVAVQGNKIILNVGFSHPVEFVVPAGITAVMQEKQLVIAGADRQMVGEVAANIRKVRKPEPYKGKGIRYSDETVRRKAGKAAKAGAA